MDVIAFLFCFFVFCVVFLTVDRTINRVHPPPSTPQPNESSFDSFFYDVKAFKISRENARKRTRGKPQNKLHFNWYMN